MNSFLVNILILTEVYIFTVFSFFLSFHLYMHIHMQMHTPLCMMRVFSYVMTHPNLKVVPFLLLCRFGRETRRRVIAEDDSKLLFFNLSLRLM